MRREPMSHRSRRDGADDSSAATGQPVNYLALAVDFDGTLATDGRVFPATVGALVRLRHSGRRLVMVTGRELPDLQATFDRLDLFDVVIAENGGLLYLPARGSEMPLAAPPPGAFVSALRSRGLPFSTGAVVVATAVLHHAAVSAVIADLGLQRSLDVILNKGALMILPMGVNKGTGIARAAAELSVPLHAIVGVGDAENDHSLLRACGLGVAVANAVPPLKEQADLLARGARGEGVVEIIDRLLAGELAEVQPRPREEIALVPREAEAQQSPAH